MRLNISRAIEITHEHGLKPLVVMLAVMADAGEFWSMRNMSELARTCGLHAGTIGEHMGRLRRAGLVRELVPGKRTRHGSRTWRKVIQPKDGMWVDVERPKKIDDVAALCVLMRGLADPESGRFLIALSELATIAGVSLPTLRKLLREVETRGMAQVTSTLRGEVEVNISD